MKKEIKHNKNHEFRVKMVKIKKIWGFIKKNWKSEVIFAIILFLLSPFYSDWIAQVTQGSKDITIYHSSAQNFNESETSDLLKDLSNINRISALAGCGILHFIVYYNLSGDVEKDKKFMWGFNGDSLIACPDCTAYSTIFFSDKEAIKDVKVMVYLNDNDVTIDYHDPMEISPPSGFPGANKFEISIDQVRGKESIGEKLSWRTKKFNDVTYDYSLGNQKCRVIKYNVALINDKEAVQKAIPILIPSMPLMEDLLNISLQKEIHLYLLNSSRDLVLDESGYTYINYSDTCEKFNLSEYQPVNVYIFTPLYGT
jgi:hypothetical protein